MQNRLRKSNRNRSTKVTILTHMKFKATGNSHETRVEYIFEANLFSKIRILAQKKFEIFFRAFFLISLGIKS